MANIAKVALWVGSAAVAASATVSVAQAGAFAIREQSACGQGASFAGVAAGCSLSSMFWNPATLMATEGVEIEMVGSGVFPTADVTVDAPLALDEGDIAQDAFVPAGYAAWRINDRVVFGLGVNSPFGLVTQYGDASLIRTSGIAGTSKVFSLNANPAVAFQVNNWLALALGAQVQYIDVRLTGQALPAPLGLSSVEGDDVGFGMTAGIQLTPAPGTQIGLGYRSRIDHELEGDLATGIGTFDVDGEDLDLPDLVTLGIRQRITDSFRVLAGAEWSNWSRFETVTLTGGPVDIPLTFDYDDGWFFSLGAEYDINPRTTLRAGVGYELSPLDDDTRTYRLPDSDRLWLSAGGSFKANERVTFDAGYTFILAEEADLLSVGEGGPIPNGPFSGSSDGHVHIISAALKVRFGGAPAAPVSLK